MKVTLLNMILYTATLMIGTYFIVETRLKQVNKERELILSEFIQLREEKLKKIMGDIVDNTVRTFKEVEEVCGYLENKINRLDEEVMNGRNNQEDN